MSKEKVSIPARSRHWNFTIFEFDEVHKTQPFCFDKVRYCIWQIEKCPDTGRLHIQGYLQLVRENNLVYMKKLHASAHWSVMYRDSTPDKCRDYCRKSESQIEGPWEYGEFKSQGKRTDLDDVMKDIRDRRPIKEVMETHSQSYAQYMRFFEKYEGLTVPMRSWKTEVYVYHGPTGTGKSHRAFQEAGSDAYVLDHPHGNTLWFNGYCGQENVIIDEFYGWIPWSTLLKMLDKYPMRVESKGSSCQFCPKKIWITSNLPPDQWYKIETVKDFSPLMRRLTKVEEMNAPINNTVDLPVKSGKEEWEPSETDISTDSFDYGMDCHERGWPSDDECDPDSYTSSSLD